MGLTFTSILGIAIAVIGALTYFSTTAYNLSITVILIIAIFLLVLGRYSQSRWRRYIMLIVGFFLFAVSITDENILLPLVSNFINSFNLTNWLIIIAGVLIILVGWRRTRQYGGGSPYNPQQFQNTSDI